MGPVDYYRLLNVSRTATIAQIKAAYRKLALQYHPDTTKIDKKSAATVFRDITLAYEVLSTESSREEYDYSIGNNRASSGSRSTGAPRSSVRTTIRTASGPVIRDHYDVNTWYAYHYAEENTDAPKRNPYEAKTKTNDWNDPTNKHQNYYRKKNAREWNEKETGTKWDAEKAYEQFRTGSDEPGQKSSQARGTAHSSKTKAEREREAVAEYERRRGAAMSNLNRRRTQRREQEEQSRSGKGESEDSACCIS